MTDMLVLIIWSFCQVLSNTCFQGLLDFLGDSKIEWAASHAGHRHGEPADWSPQLLSRDLFSCAAVVSALGSSLDYLTRLP